MLVLTRKLGEKILIGSDITITVVDIDSRKVRIGIQAPPDLKIWREEVTPATPVNKSHQVDK